MIKSHTIWAERLASESEIKAHEQAWEGRQEWKADGKSYQAEYATRRYFRGPSIVNQIKRRNHRRMCAICLMHNWSPK